MDEPRFGYDATCTNSSGACAHKYTYPPAVGIWAIWPPECAENA
jgi:hypothetical protein